MKKLFLAVLLLFNILTYTCYAADTEADLQPVKISAAAMESQLDKEQSTNLYVKISEDEVLVYQNTAQSRSLRKQLILNAPADKINRLYTTDEKTFKQMSKMLRDYESNKTDLGGYRIMTDTDLAKDTDSGHKIYRFWFMKVTKEEKESRFPIGIGIGIGGGHHRPWIGIGL